MNTPPRRARFQIHLSTAIVLIFVAGGLIWANVNAGSRFCGMCRDENGTSYSITKVYGWPFRFGFSEAYTETTIMPSLKFEPVLAEDALSMSEVAIDSVIGLFILFFVWFLLEWLIRRRAARKAGDA